jgi:hypothetical protein
MTTCRGQREIFWKEDDLCKFAGGISEGGNNRIYVTELTNKMGRAAITIEKECN